MAAAAVLWSSGGLGIKLLPLAPLAISFYRAAIAGAALWVILRPRRVPIRPALAAAVLAYAGTVVTFVVATKLTTSANAIFLQDSGIVWVLLFSPLIARDPVGRRDLAAAGACLAGMALFFGGRLSHAGLTGNLVGVVSGMFYATLILLLRRQDSEGAQWSAILGCFLAAAVSAPLAGPLWPLSAREAAILLLLGTVQIGVAYALFIAGLRAIPAFEASLVALLEPLLNPVWVFLGVGERPSSYAAVGAAIVLSAIAWRTLSARRPAPS